MHISIEKNVGIMKRNLCRIKETFIKDCEKWRKKLNVINQPNKSKKN